MEKNWVKLIVGSNSIELEITKQMLEEHDIPAVLINKQDSSYRFGQIELFVHESKEAEARLLLAIQDVSGEDPAKNDGFTNRDDLANIDRYTKNEGDAKNDERDLDTP